MPESAAMKLLPMCVIAMLYLFWVVAPVGAQTASPPAKSPEAAQLEALAKKIDEQNAKIDTLSQQILKLQQEFSEKRPGIIIGEGAAATPSAPPADSTAQPAAAGNTHTVARGETLTSIAKMYKVSVDELQRVNHIDNPLKLQAGQTLTVPTSATSTAPTASPPGE